MLQPILALLLTALGGLTGAWLSDHSKHGGHWAWLYLTGAISVGSWAWLTKCATTPLAVTSAIWDVVYTVTFSGTLFCLTRAEVTNIQVIGVLFVLVGTFLLGR